MALLTVGHGRGSRATNGHVKRPLWVAAVQGIEKTSIQCLFARFGEPQIYFFAVAPTNIDAKL